MKSGTKVKYMNKMQIIYQLYTTKWKNFIFRYPQMSGRSNIIENYSLIQSKQYIKFFCHLLVKIRFKLWYELKGFPQTHFSHPLKTCKTCFWYQMIQIRSNTLYIHVTQVPSFGNYTNNGLVYKQLIHKQQQTYDPYNNLRAFNN